VIAERPLAPSGAAPAAGARVTPASVIAVATVLGLGLRLYQLARPGFLLGAPQYDDGVDFGGAIRLLQGFVPYRDFVFVQPPGITLLLAPVALLAKATSSDTGLAVARVLTACAGAASVPLTGLLVKHRGALATAAACAIVALHPDSIFSASTVFLEPWLVLFCLLGAVLLFDSDALALSGRRLVWGGVAFGVAGVVKAWAALPALVVLALLCRGLDWRRPARYAGGVAAGFLVPAGAFIALAPHAFVRDIVSAQLSRSDVVRTSLTTRLRSLLGPTHLALSSVAVVVACVVVLAFVVACLALARRRPPALELFALASAALILVAFLWPVDYFGHYAGLFAPFLALSVVLPASRALAAVAVPTRAVPALGALLCLAIAGAAVHELVDETHLGTAPRPARAEHLIAAGACVLSDNPSFTIAANRFVSSAPGCSPLLDGIGTDYALGGGHTALNGAGRFPAVQAAWLAAFARARYVWLACAGPRNGLCDQSTNRRIPWTTPILDYFVSHFRPLAGAPYPLFVRAR